MGTVTDDPRLRERRFVFSDRHDAGRQLGELIRALPPFRDPVVLAIPAGGVPIGAEIARAIHAKFGLAIVRKIQIPGNTEAGFGAVTWDGNVLVNEILRSALDLTETQVESAVGSARQNVADRIARFSGGFPLPEIAGRTVICTDDGLASGFTMLAAVASIRKLGPDQIIVAVPTGSAATVDTVSRQVDRLICLNIRNVSRFAVAEAYKRWHDLDDNEVIAELALFRPVKRTNR